MVQTLEVRVIFEISDPAILTQIGWAKDEKTLQEMRELGLIDSQDRMTIFGLYAQEAAEDFCDEESKKKREANQRRAESARERKQRDPAERGPTQQTRIFEQERQKWIARRDNAPTTPMNKMQMARATGVSLSAIQMWSKKGFFRGERDVPREVLTRYLEHRYHLASKRPEIELSREEERELAEILQETGV